MFKTRLQLLAQNIACRLPVYHTEKLPKSKNAKSEFRASVAVNGKSYIGRGAFPRKKIAENAAAEVALEELRKEGRVEKLTTCMLQEMALQKGWAPPKIRTRKFGLSHSPVFMTEVEVQGISKKIAAAPKKKDSERWAVTRVIQDFNGDGKLGERKTKHLCNIQWTFVESEGDIIFSLMVTKPFWSASLQPTEQLLSFYESMEKTISCFEKAEALIIRGVNVTSTILNQIFEGLTFDRIVFSFPHVGFDEPDAKMKKTRKKRSLLNEFLSTAKTLVDSNGEIHVRVKKEEPYNDWGVVERAEKNGLCLKGATPVLKEDFQIYNSKGDALAHPPEDFKIADSVTYIFHVRG